MGSNDSLPPPVPPGEPPRVPPPPPAVPQFAPTEPIAATPPPPITEQLPATQVMPPVPPPPGAVPPPGGVSPSGGQAPGEPSKQHLVPWIIGAAVLVVALVLVAVFALRGDDESSGSADTTAPSVEPTTTVEVASSVATTLAPTTAPATVAPTTPTTAAASTTVAPSTTLPDAVVVADDTGVFTVLLLDTFEIDSAPRELAGVQTATVVGATDLAGFDSPDDHDTFGIGVAVGPSDQLPSVDELLAAADPGPSVCADRSTKADYPTQVGSAQVLLLDGCGTGGLSAKVVFVLTFPDRNLTMLVGSQGPGPSATDLFDFTQAVVESVVFL